MANPTKTGGRTLLAWTSIATGNVTVGADLDVSTLFALAVVAHYGRNPANGTNTAGWPNIRIEGSTQASGNDDWSPIAVFTVVPGNSLGNTTLNGAISAGAASALLTSASNFAVGDLIFLGHTTTAANYELVRIKGVSSNTVTFEEPCKNAHDNGAAVSDQAEIFALPYVDVSALMRVRAVFDNANSGRTNAVRVLASSLDAV